ncbi:MAG TPA: hypothetical protein VGN28_06160 [Blastococcus sp.]|jgi:hypothetical protein|nr:hypothetical protein [Blastococcus sp.]
MTSLRTSLARRRSLRGRIREERALLRALAAAPTLEAAHEIASLHAHD